jgi:hypothetical protein
MRRDREIHATQNSKTSGATRVSSTLTFGTRSSGDKKGPTAHSGGAFLLHPYLPDLFSIHYHGGSAIVWERDVGGDGRVGFLDAFSATIWKGDEARAAKRQYPTVSYAALHCDYVAHSAVLRPIHQL